MKTPLYDLHQENGGKLVDFAGWELPVRFEGIIPEHMTVRQNVGMFDVSHMGEIFLEGPEAEQALSYFCCNDISKIKDGQAQYTALLNEEGGVIDDLIAYRFNTEKYLLCVNASNAEEDFAWLMENNKFNVSIENHSSDYGQIAVQGPKAVETLSKIFPEVSKIQKFYFAEIDGFIFARTGYTGEDGFEVFCPASGTPELWQRFLDLGIKPCGLGARDSLRLEAGYPLHGHELRPNIPALVSGLGWIVKFDHDFIGKDALENLTQTEELIKFKVSGPGIAREDTELFDSTSQKVGFVTSGTKIPGHEFASGMAIVNKDINQEIYAQVRNKQLEIRTNPH